jgi:tetratricopeptide (TPR) repeat protein
VDPFSFVGSYSVQLVAQAEDVYGIGDRIGSNCEILDVLGLGGFGIVYLVRLLGGDDRHLLALKTFRDLYLNAPEVRQRFRHEAQMLVDLDHHPNLLWTFFVEEMAGRLYVATEYIAPGPEGLNSLDGYLVRGPPDMVQSLCWAVQCCYGLEHAYSRGLRCHRDLKPANILITHDHVAKIADFGLAGALSQASLPEGIHVHFGDGQIGLSGQTLKGRAFGTPTHMAPEQFADSAACDQRSDVYSFGVVLYQMVSGGRLPFATKPPRQRTSQEMERFWYEIRRLHELEPTPQLDSPLSPIIQRCMQKEPDERYQSFQEVRKELESLLEREAGVAVDPPIVGSLTSDQWILKGGSLVALDCHEKAIGCFEQAIAVDRSDALAWSGKGFSLAGLGYHEAAIDCCDQALALDARSAESWRCKGSSLLALGQVAESIRCYDRALDIDPRAAGAWIGKGRCLALLDRLNEAVACCDRELALDPQCKQAWYNKGLWLDVLNRRAEALICYEGALFLDQWFAEAWNGKGSLLAQLDRGDEALECFHHAVTLNPTYKIAWFHKAQAEEGLGHPQEAIRSYERFLDLASPQDTLQIAIAYARYRLRDLTG